MTYDMLSQNEIDALLRGVSGEEETSSKAESSREERPYDPANQHRVIRERLHALDIVNDHFARSFRVGLRSLLRRNPDITVQSMSYQSYSDFASTVPTPANLNLVSLKPLRGVALMAFPPALIYMVIDNLFGGDGLFLTKSEGKDFTFTEQRIIKLILDEAIACYQDAWESIFPIQIEYLRSEMQTHFANVTSSPNEIVVNTTFNLEMGTLSSEFNITMPYSMIEPIKQLLNGSIDEQSPEEERIWNTRLSGGLDGSMLELKADFVSVESTMAQLIKLKVGDVLTIDLPDTVVASVDDIPVMLCEFGHSPQGGQRSIRVLEMIDHRSLQGEDTNVLAMLRKAAVEPSDAPLLP